MSLIIQKTPLSPTSTPIDFSLGATAPLSPSCNDPFLADSLKKLCLGDAYDNAVPADVRTLQRKIALLPDNNPAKNMLDRTNLLMPYCEEISLGNASYYVYDPLPSGQIQVTKLLIAFYQVSSKPDHFPPVESYLVRDVKIDSEYNILPSQIDPDNPALWQHNGTFDSNLSRFQRTNIRTNVTQFMTETWNRLPQKEMLSAYLYNSSISAGLFVGQEHVESWDKIVREKNPAKIEIVEVASDSRRVTAYRITPLQGEAFTVVKMETLLEGSRLDLEINHLSFRSIDANNVREASIQLSSSQQDLVTPQLSYSTKTRADVTDYEIYDQSLAKPGYQKNYQLFWNPLRRQIREIDAGE